MQTVRFTIAAKPASASRPVSVTYARTYLARLGYLGDGLVRLPVFGLYAGLANQVAIEATFTDASTRALASRSPRSPGSTRGELGPSVDPQVVDGRLGPWDSISSI
jgi:hypothetical protein